MNYSSEIMPSDSGQVEGDEVRNGKKKSDASGNHEVFCIGKQSRKTSGMDKDYGFVFSDDPFSDLIDHAGHGFTGINRIEENPLGFSNQFQGIPPLLGKYPISLTNVFIGTEDI